MERAKFDSSVYAGHFRVSPTRKPDEELGRLREIYYSRIAKDREVNRRLAGGTISIKPRGVQL